MSVHDSDGISAVIEGRRGEAAGWPSVTIVFLVYNRCVELRTSLQRMLHDSDYEPGRVDVIVVDNASTDGSAAMVRDEFPSARLIVRGENIGVSGWNEGLAAARGDYVLALDDDCFLPSDGLRQAVSAAERENADLVSFKVVSTHDPEHVFSETYRTGLFTFWGCSVLMRRHVVEALDGYDPEIFVWANELELMLRFFDQGFRHLHLPEVVAQHMKPAPTQSDDRGWERGYRLNARHWTYIAGKLLAPRDAWETFVARLVHAVRDGLLVDRGALKALPDTVYGFGHGLRHRAPVRNREVSRFYRRNFETFASPWWLSRPPAELLRTVPRETLRRIRRRGSSIAGSDRLEQYLDERAAFYPDRAALLEFSPAPTTWPMAQPLEPDSFRLWTPGR